MGAHHPHFFMDKEKLKLIVRNLKSLVDVLESEVYSDVTAYKYEDRQQLITDYDEVFDDDDGYPINEGQKSSKENHQTGKKTSRLVYPAGCNVC